MKKSVLVIEDNVDLAFGLRNNLEIEGYTVDVAHDGSAGLEKVQRSPFDLVILDLMLPEMDGFRVLRNVREKGMVIPVLILTARGAESDKVQGLKLGADDYVTKPFGVLELLARVEALIRRNRLSIVKSPPEPERFGEIEIDIQTRTVMRGQQAVSLTPKEFDLLLALVERRGAVVSRMDLLRQVWGYSDAVISRTVDSHIAELRRKLEEDAAVPRHILTVRKVGYRLKS
ncbi:MAG: response regulator transcription factor [Acidobacteriota bacterium]